MYKKSGTHMHMQNVNKVIQIFVIEIKRKAESNNKENIFRVVPPPCKN